MLRKGTEYRNICTICVKRSPKGTEYRNVSPSILRYSVPLPLNLTKYYKYYDALRLSA